MTNSIKSFLFLQQVLDTPVTRVLLHLLRHPHDLIDARHLMRQLKVTTQDFLAALEQLEHHHESSHSAVTA